MIINCKEIRENLLTEIKQEVDKIDTRIKACILTCEGFDFASSKYITNKIKTLESVGMACEVIDISGVTKSETLCNIRTELTRIAKDSLTHGVLVQMPISHGIKIDDFVDFIPEVKDLDGFTEKFIKPCTPSAVMKILESLDIDLAGKNVLVINRSKIVGLPLINMLLDKDCTVTVAHSKTKGLDKHLRIADIIIAAVGIPNFLDLTKVGIRKIVIDVAITRDENGLCGDFSKKDYESEYIKVTPVGGGVGILTTTFVAKNLLDCYKLQNGEI